MLGLAAARVTTSLLQDLVDGVAVTDVRVFGVTAIALVPLTIWAAYGVIKLAAGDYDAAVAWVSDPLNATLLALTLAISFWHMHAGLRVVVEDYIHKALSKSALLILNLFVCGLAAALAIFSILKVAFMGGGAA